MHDDTFRRIHGACLCGGIRFHCRTRPGPVVYCHCSQCRKAQGVPFGANSPVPAAAFVIDEGEELLRAFRASPGKQRVFCARCGSPIYSKLDGADVVRVRTGLLDAGSGLLRAHAHIFYDSHASWVEAADDLPRYAGHEPGR